MLFAAVKKYGLTDRLWSLVMLEWSNNSERLLSPVVLELLDRADGTERLVPLFAARWRPAGNASRWSLLEENLVPLRRRLLPDHALVWLTILVEQMRFGVWRPTSASAEQWLKSWLFELAQLGDLQLKASNQFDEADQWRDLRHEVLGMPSANTTTSEIRDLLRAATFEDRMAIKTRRAKLADGWRRQPSVALYELDALAGSRPITLMRFRHECLWSGTSLFSCPLADAEPEAQRQTLQRPLRRILSLPPDEARLVVAAYCLKELMTVSEFCLLANQHAPPIWKDSVRILTNHTAIDVSLHCLCQLFRAVESDDTDIALT